MTQLQGTITIDGVSFNTTIDTQSKWATFSGGDFIGECKFMVLSKDEVRWSYGLPAQSESEQRFLPHLKQYFIERFFQ